MKYIGMMCAINAVMWGMVPLSWAGAGDAQAGKQKSALCQSCHGENGQSTDPTVPKLAGQFADYIMKQIMDFQLQNRHDPRMSPMAASIANAQDLKDIAAYFSVQAPMKGAPGKGSQIPLGKHIYESGNAPRKIAACASCHGLTGRSKDNALFPMIGGQHKAYLSKQMEDFRTGKRATDQSGSMESSAKALTKEELDAVLEYVAGL